MAENGWFDPMLLESRLPYPESLVKTPLVVATVVAEHPACKEVTEAGAKGSSLLDPRLSPEHGDSGLTQVGEGHGRGTLTGSIGNGRTIVLEQQQEERPSLLDPPTQCSRKRKNWSAEETDLLLEAVIAERMKSRSRLDNEPLWEGVAKRVPGRAGKECRMRMETLKKSYIAVKEYCDEEKKQFGELKVAEFGKMKLATQIMERWYHRIRDHYPPKPSKKPRGLGRCSGSDVATRGGRPGVRESDARPPLMIMFRETTRSSDFGVDGSTVLIIWLVRLEMDVFRKKLEQSGCAMEIQSASYTIALFVQSAIYSACFIKRLL